MRDIAEQQNPPSDAPPVFYQSAYNAPSVVELPTIHKDNPKLGMRGFFESDSSRVRTYEENKDSVGRLWTKDATGKTVAWGSATVVSDTGLVVSDLHAINNQSAQRLEISLGGKTYQARVLDHDPQKDLALLQIVPNNNGERFKPVKFGSSQELRQGDEVTGLGMPRQSNTLYISPGRFGSEKRYGELPIKPGQHIQDDPSRPVLVTDMNSPPGTSGGGGFDKQAKFIGLIDLANEAGSMGVITPVEDVLAFIRRSQQNFTPNMPSEALGSTRNYYDRITSSLPDWMRNLHTAAPTAEKPNQAVTGARSGAPLPTGDAYSKSYWRQRLSLGYWLGY
jgi:S1-C subfamily serine protease